MDHFVFYYAYCMFVEVTGIFFETMKEKMELFRTKRDKFLGKEGGEE